MTEKFKDYFSTQSAGYSGYRPDYPPQLFDYIVSLVPERNVVWDCATGNGQAAVSLSKYFTQVIATDASDRQIAHAKPQDNIEYKVAGAESSGLGDGSVDLVTVAQALHWFRFNDFFSEVKRVLKPGGVLAAWSYGLFSISPDVDKIVSSLYSDVLHNYWPPERKHVDERYRQIQFPFNEISTPDFLMEKEWSSDQIIGYLNSWSSVQGYIKENGHNPVEDIRGELLRLLTKPTRVVWPVTLRLSLRQVP